jgi:hypothetical protein
MDAKTIHLLILLATPIISSLVVTGVKQLAPKIPPWLLPAVSALAGALTDVLNSYATSAPADPSHGFVLGLAGVGLRELIDQTKRAAGVPSSRKHRERA